MLKFCKKSSHVFGCWNSAKIHKFLGAIILQNTFSSTSYVVNNFSFFHSFYFFLAYFLLSSFPFTLSLGHWLSQLCWPLHMAELVLTWCCGCMAYFFWLFLVVNNPFTQRKDSYSTSPIDGASLQFRIPVTFFEEWGVRLNEKLICAWKTISLLLLEAGFELGSPL